jgi:hypothetical protein
MSYRMQSLNRVTSERFATSPLSPGAIDLRDLYSARGRLGAPGLRCVSGPDLRSRVTRFGQGVAFQAPHVFMPKQVAVTAKPTVTVPGLPGFPFPKISITLPKPGPVSGPPKIVITSLPPLGGQPAPFKPVPVPTPTSAGAPPTGGTDSPLTWNPGMLGPGGGTTDQGYTPAPAPVAMSSDGGASGGLSDQFPASGGAAAPTSDGSSSLLWLGLGALGLLFLATQR